MTDRSVEPSLRPLVFRHLGQRDYEEVWHAMQTYTDTRDEQALDEIWFVEHPPVFTQGQAGKSEHLLFAGDIPVVKVDRGGQITYHGPGQLVAYFLLDIKRLNIGVRELVTRIEKMLVDVLEQHHISAYPKADAPGVYVDEKKIASLGLRIRRGCSFHGLALNVNMDMRPFNQINPCGYAGLEMVQMIDFRDGLALNNIANDLMPIITQRLDYSVVEELTGFNNE